MEKLKIRAISFIKIITVTSTYCLIPLCYINRTQFKLQSGLSPKHFHLSKVKGEGGWDKREKLRYREDK